MKRTVFHIAVAACFLAACSQHEPAVPVADTLRFEAAWEEDGMTRNAVQSNGTSVWWTPGDQILILKESGAYGCFTSTLTAPAPNSSFVGAFQESETKSSADNGYVAFYPYGFVNGIDNNGLYVMNLPAAQYGMEGTFADKFFPAAARSGNEQLHFRHICGGARFSVCHQGISAVTFQSLGGEPLWAESIGLQLDGDGIPTVEKRKKPKDQVTVLAPDGGFVPGEYYYAAFLPGTLSQGLSIRFDFSGGDSQTLTMNRSIQVRRARFGQLDQVDSGISILTTVDYTEADGEVLNPERGMYYTHEIRKASANIASSVKAKVASGHKVQLLEFYLTDFMEQDISDSYLEAVQRCFDAIRDGGAKAIVRFAYKDSEANFPTEMMEPEVPQVMAHVAQLKPYLQQNEDVLFVLQAGFIGCWGEWYYTNHFVMSPKTDEDYALRRQLTEALLDAVPDSRQIELRTPKFKMRMYKLSVADTLTAATAHNGSPASRLAGHNDCFGASADDYGTFEGEDTRQFWKADTRYTIMGGETCNVSNYCLCPNSLKDLEDYHWTYLHSGYNTQVLNRWKKDGCMDEIKARLGYRLILERVTYAEVKAGQPCQVTLRLQNKGFAAPMNPRLAYLVWVDADGSTKKFALSADPRTWHPGVHEVAGSFTPVTQHGTLYLELPDPLLPGRPEYSIALANKNVFDETTGYNKLFAL